VLLYSTKWMRKTIRKTIRDDEIWYYVWWTHDVWPVVCHVKPYVLAVKLFIETFTCVKPHCVFADIATIRKTTSHYIF
jgi:hypothetical protein